MTDDIVIPALLITIYFIPLMICICVIICHFDYKDYFNKEYTNLYKVNSRKALALDLFMSAVPIINFVLSTTIVNHYFNKLKSKYDYK